MISNKRRTIIISVSVAMGTVLAYFLTLSRKKDLEPGDYGTLFINMLLAAAILIGIGVIFRMKGNKK